jgi:hypothetical protein
VTIFRERAKNATEFSESRHQKNETSILIFHTGWYCLATAASNLQKHSINIANVQQNNLTMPWRQIFLYTKTKCVVENFKVGRCRLNFQVEIVECIQTSPLVTDLSTAATGLRSKATVLKIVPALVRDSGSAAATMPLSSVPAAAAACAPGDPPDGSGATFCSSS